MKAIARPLYNVLLHLSTSIRELAPSAGISEERLEYGYISVEEYVVKNGQQYEPEALTNHEQHIVSNAIRAAMKRGCRFKPQECFKNAQLLVVSSASPLKYVEGFVSSMVPVHHAWATINNKVVDLTLRFGVTMGGLDHGPQKVKLINELHRDRLGNRIYGIWPEIRDYVGVQFDRVDVVRHINNPKSSTASLIETPERMLGKII